MSLKRILDRDDAWTIVRGEALALLASMPDACVDAVITDPPYSSGGAFRCDRTVSSTGAKYLTSDVKAHRPNFAGDTRDQRGFSHWCALWLAEALRVSRSGAPICVFSDWRQLPTVTDALQAGGWIWRGISVWNKNGARPVAGRFTAQCEYIVWGSAGAMPLRRGVGVLPGEFLCSSRGREKLHQTGKPVDVMRWLVSICAPGGLVLDPFAGSGSTGIACLREGRRFVGFELTEDYARIARDRMAAEVRSQPTAPMMEPTACSAPDSR